MQVDCNGMPANMFKCSIQYFQITQKEENLLIS